MTERAAKTFNNLSKKDKILINTTGFYNGTKFEYILQKGAHQMPQIQLPIFSEGITNITNELGFKKEEGSVVYFNGHLPVFKHDEKDIQTFRMITSQFIVTGLAKHRDIAKTFGVSLTTVKRAVKLYRQKGVKGFYEKRKRCGACAHHIRELKNHHFPEAVFILDWAHALNHLTDCAKAAFGEGTIQALRWYEKHKLLLWEGTTEPIIEHIRRLSKHLGSPRDNEPQSSPRRILYQNAFSYFPNNKNAMNYPFFRAQGWPIGSGVAEGAIKQFAIRMKGSEKFWNISNTGAEEMLALCALYHSDDSRWNHYWHKRALPR